MKKIAFIIISVSLIFLTSCNKYEDGPAFSFKSATKRITGTFILEKRLINGKEIPFEDLNIIEERVTYNKNGTGEKLYKLYNSSDQLKQIEWEFDKKKENIKEREMGLDGTWGSWTPYMKILRLTKDELWIVFSNSVETTESHYVKQ